MQIKVAFLAKEESTSLPLLAKVRNQILTKHSTSSIFSTFFMKMQ